MRYTEEPVKHTFMWIPGPQQGSFYHGQREYMTWNIPLSSALDQRGQCHTFEGYLCLPRQMTEAEYQRILKCIELYKDALVVQVEPTTPSTKEAALEGIATAAPGSVRALFEAAQEIASSTLLTRDGSYRVVTHEQFDKLLQALAAFEVGP